MDFIDVVLTLFTDLQGDENLDLSEYSSRFVDVSEAIDEIANQFNTHSEIVDGYEATIKDLKGENWDMSKRLTSRDKKDEDETVEDENTEDEKAEETYEDVDAAIEDLFKKEEEE